jgi:hypothetical protein
VPLTRQQPGLGAAAAAAAVLGRAMSRSASVTLREAVLARAGSFRDAHFGGARSGGGPGGGGGLGGGAGAAGGLESDALRELRAACAALPGGEPAALQRVLSLLNAPDLSVFELLTSGAVRALSDYMRGADLAHGAKRDEQLLKRLSRFAAAALAASGGAPGSAPMAALVRKLQSALASTEAFPVVCSRVGAPPGAGASRSLGRSGSFGGSFGAGGNSLSSGLQALIEPFKLRLVRHPNVRLWSSARRGPAAQARAPVAWRPSTSDSSCRHAQRSAAVAPVNSPEAPRHATCLCPHPHPSPCLSPFSSPDHRASHRTRPYASTRPAL